MKSAQMLKSVLSSTSTDRRCQLAWTSSAVVHVVLVTLLACLWLSDPETPQPGLDSGWTGADEDSTPPLEIEQPATDRADEEDGGSLYGSTAMLPIADSVKQVRVSQSTLLPSAAFMADDFPADDLADQSGIVLGRSDNRGQGEGDGSGDGKGDGSGGGFFGNRAAGKSFVFVVDCSGSMNHPHPSRARTRFGRLKLELLRTISAMDDSMKFFIIFFNDQARPMPASSLQPGVKQVQQHYLYWMQRVRAVGETDPREAMSLALRLKPDVIYFLTDGSFRRRINDDLLGIRQRTSAIHTIAFGERGAEPVLRQIAEQNRGEYQFIP